MCVKHSLTFISIHLDSKKSFIHGNEQKSTMNKSNLNNHLNLSHAGNIYYNRSTWNYMGKSYDNWQIMIQVPVNFYDTVMF